MGAKDFDSRMNGYLSGGDYRDATGAAAHAGSNGPRGGFLSGLMSFPFRLAMAALAGLIVVAALRYGRFRLWDEGLFAGDPARAMVLDGVIALLAGFCAVLYLRRSMFVRLTGYSLGAVAAISMMHNLVWKQPEMFASIYSEGWVQTVRQETRPDTAIVLGDSYPLSMDGLTQFSTKVGAANLLDINWLRDMLENTAEAILKTGSSEGA